MPVSRTLILVLTVAGSLAPAAVAAQSTMESVTLPPSTQRGLDMVTVDPDAMPLEPEFAKGAPIVQDESWSGAPVDLLKPIHPLYTDFRRQLVRYQIKWSHLPQVRVAAEGGTMVVGSRDPRVSALRERLGVGSTGGFDEALRARLVEYQQAHGLAADGKAGAGSLASLNRGAAYYERQILLNMERARRLPGPGTTGKYLVVDAGAARLWMYDGGKPKDSMRVIVGNAETPTPMMAAMMRYVSLNPYWNVPPELARDLVAKKVVVNGLSYLLERDYEVLSDWSEDPALVDPTTVDWQAVADGSVEIRLRRKPGPWNSMGKIKFMLPNEFGIYLHDVPDKSHFADDDRWLSNGCVRLEDPQRLATWIFGAMPQSETGEADERIDLPSPVPVYMTYFTVEPSASSGAIFRADPYRRDAPLLAAYDGVGMQDPDLSALASVDTTEVVPPEPPQTVRHGAQARKKSAPESFRSAKASSKPAAKSAISNLKTASAPAKKDRSNTVASAVKIANAR